MEWSYVAIALAVLLVLALVWYLATAGSRRAKQEEQNRLEAASIRERAADRQQQVAQQEAAAAQVQADAARTQARAERQAREAELKRQEAAGAQEQAERARMAHQEQLRQADLLDPDVRTDDRGNRLDDATRVDRDSLAANDSPFDGAPHSEPQQVRHRDEAHYQDGHRTIEPEQVQHEGQTPPHQEPVRPAPAADYQTTMQPVVEPAVTQQGQQQVSSASYTEYPTPQQRDLGDRDPAPVEQAGPVSYSEYPTEMSQRERMLRQAQGQEIDLRDGQGRPDPTEQKGSQQGQSGRLLADRLMDPDDQAR